VVYKLQRSRESDFFRQMPVPSKTEKTAFVLAGGGSLGALQVGMLAEILEAGEHPDFIVGVSAGAINGAFLAHSASTEMIGRMSALWTGTSTREILGLSWRSVLGLIGLRDHVANPAGLRLLLRRALPYELLEHTATPLHVVCAELVTGEEVVLSSGNVLDAILASAAIPGVFPGVAHLGRVLVDGAIAASSPVSVALELGASRVIVLPCGFACAQRNVPKHALGRAMHAITLTFARQLRHDFERHSDQLEMRIVPPLCPMAQSAYDYSHGAELIARARESTKAWIRDGGLGRCEFPGPLNIHRH
jgi:NTE family protein